MRTIVLSATLGLLITGIGRAGDCCSEAARRDEPACHTQGSCHCCNCGKVCRVVCETKKVKKTVWVVECEEFCAPLPGCNAGHCKGKTDCCEEDCCGDPCASLHRLMVPPRCGRVRCRKKLTKKEISCEVPVYKCVLCGGCCNCPTQGCGMEDTDVPVPAAPAKAPSKAVPMPSITGRSYR